MQILKNSKEAINASWMIGGKILQMIVSLIVSLLTARYLGPSNYGLINYATTYVAFFTSLCSLGINAVIIKDFVDNPDEQGSALGTTVVLRLISSMFSLVIIYFIVNLVDYGEMITIAVVMLSSISLVFHVFDILNCWFQYKYQAKTIAIASFLAYAVVAFYKITLLVSKKNICWFALSTSIDYIVIAAVLIYAYYRNSGPRLKFSLKKGFHLLRKSYPYIFSGMLVAVYAQTDKMMLKQMLSDTEVGYYSTASAICSMWTFVLAAIIDAMFPTIYRVYAKDRKVFERKNRQLYAIVEYMSLIVSLIFTVFGKYIIFLLYGVEYLEAVNPLRIITWGTAFTYLGVARHAWIVCENMQKYLTVISAVAAILNIVMNYYMIPVMGASGAALASVTAQFITCFIVPYFIKGMRSNLRLMIEALTLKDFFNK